MIIEATLGKPNQRCIVTVGCSPRIQQTRAHFRFTRSIRRMLKSLSGHYQGHFIAWVEETPTLSPDPSLIPMGFKPAAMNYAAAQGFTEILWLDSSLYAKGSLEHLFRRIAEDGYSFFNEADPPESMGVFCKDEALDTLGIDRELSFAIPEVWTCCVGITLASTVGARFLSEWHRLSLDGVSFPGPKWSGTRGYPRTASQDTRVLGHRFDQTAASAIAYKNDMSKRETRSSFDTLFVNDRLYARFYFESGASAHSAQLLMWMRYAKWLLKP